jgi:hypothetical protein
MAKPNSIELPDWKPVRILYENHTALCAPGLPERPKTEWRRAMPKNSK